MPSLTVETSRVARLPDGGGRSPRAVYLRAVDPEAMWPAERLPDEIRAELRRVAGEPTGERAGPERLDDLASTAGAWSGEMGRRYLALLDRVPDPDDRDVLVRRAALGSAPQALVSGAWLQWLTDPGNADDPVALQILALYASDLGVGHPSASRGAAYLALLRQLRLSEHAVPAGRLAGDPRIADQAFYQPALLLTMSRRPDDFRPEILGADLCLRAVGLLPALHLVKAVLPTAADWTAIDPGAGRHNGSPDLRRGRAAVDAFLAAAGEDGAQRVGLGFRWALSAVRRWSDHLYGELDAARDPAYEMAELLRARAREGAVYHQGFQLRDRSLSDWLQDCRTDPTEFLDVLAASRLVKPGRSAASALVCGLVDERGPMFRVFAPEDLAVIRRWIDSLGGDRPSGPARPPRTALDGPTLALPSLDAPPAGSDRAPATLREAYHRLQRRTDTPALRRFALDYVHGWLARARHGLDEAGNQLPARWPREGLRPWLLEQHDRHAMEFESGSGLPSREALIDSTVQLAPLTLIDGAWLQGFTDYEHASSEPGHFLLETYWDELGNGEPRLNHPLIYRQVLAEMGVDLPATASWEFAHSPLLRDESFALPVYWLSVGRLPRTFLPEILGLNMAMELSGVGGSYRRARIALKTYGFSTRFVDIHNTIDNVATGHSAWAADAVDTYLAAIAASQGTRAQAAVWDRVRAGYRSLSPPDGYLARRAQRRAQRTGAAA